MLTEQFIASISASTKPNAGVTKDAGIFFHEFQPLPAQRYVFKKSATPPNCLAVSRSHIFAAQAEKAVVHIYSREKGNQEAIVPFQERIRSIALASKDTALLLGMESGRILAWEICSGRLVSTSTSHLQPVTAIVVDPASNFFLSGSSDSMIHVWNLPSILSFSPDASRAPIRTLSSHRSPITGLTCGHSHSTANLAISISQDKSAIVWDYHNGQALRTYLLPASPMAVTLDPADRAIYVAYEDGSLQTISFYDEVQQSTPTDLLRDSSSLHRPIQPSPKTRFNAESQKLGGALSLSLCWDGTTLISGHSSGKMAVWDLAKGNYISTIASLPGPVTNLQFLPPTGFPNASEPKCKIHTVVKPRQDLGAVNGGSGLVPANYTLNMQFTGRLSIPNISAAESRRSEKTGFEEALNHPSFPTHMLEESLAELETWNSQPNGHVASTSDFLSFSSLDGSAQDGEDEVKELKKQLASLQRVQKVTFKQLADLREEKQWFTRREKRRAVRKELRAKKKFGLLNNDGDGDVKMGDASKGSGSEDIESGSSEVDTDDNDENNSASSKSGSGRESSGDSSD
ncbi:WD40 repeat-like protein [Lindgomyces ingoldianus]|uniref:WD40 repeat-like protein n=1 Tax=Lindgomyces ingoldianus TaxID=673940 RepID=A0ACB6QJR9_9PLEO|nr:WD40 repeat-like protein [Lindgomyces ingoldianus]KAF2467199.1 WD40 repeat-like protein [Lindgomyces ingoldianus]